jgi:hypothetical protein
MDWSKIEKDLNMHTEYLTASRRERTNNPISNSFLGDQNGRSGFTIPATSGRRNLYATEDNKFVNTSNPQGTLQYIFFAPC